MAGNDADGSDATQEALIAIVRGLPKFNGKAQFGTWVYRVATNAALDELRRRSRRPLVGLPDERKARRFIGATPGTSDPADLAIGRIHLDEALAKLPEAFRVAVVLRDVAGFTYAEIAEILRIPLGTVRSRIARGRSLLARTLRRGEGNPEFAHQRHNGKP